jgi:hypothetical protein
MRNLLILSLVFLVGCTAVPVKRNFPSIPPSLEKSCNVLEEVQNTTKLSDVLIVVTNNYTIYHECKIKVETWQQWYKEQKQIFESVK